MTLLECPSPTIAEETGDVGGSGSSSAPSSSLEATRRLIILTILYAIPAIVVMRPVVDPDIWWHLRTGQWIVEHGKVTTTDPFSSFGQGNPWVAYSWLFELVIYGLYQVLGLAGILIYRVAMVYAVAVAIHRFVSKREPRFVMATGLTGLAFLPIVYLMSERPWLITVLFFTMTMDTLLDLRAGRDTRAVWLLPIVYALWANVHIQFIHGLFVLGLACAAPLIDRLFVAGRTGEDACRLGSRRWRELVALTVACTLATLCNPYGLQIYRVVFEYATKTGAYDLVEEHLGMDFRAAWNWALLAMALGAAAVLGRRRRVSSFDVLLLTAAAYFSFHSRRDNWFMVITALAILTMGDRPKTFLLDRFAMTPRRVLTLGVGVLLMLAAIGWWRGLSRQRLEQAVGEQFPVRAAAYVEEQGFGGPLYNGFEWGGYLMWRLPDFLVAMDGRTNLHGDARMLRSYQTWHGQRGWDDDPDLEAARLVIGDSASALVALLRSDPRFRLVYEDKLATVFISRPGPTVATNKHPKQVTQVKD
jgi:hypothetical protein